MFKAFGRIEGLGGLVNRYATSTCFLAASAMLAIVPAQSAPLQPDKKWNVDYGETHCVASRAYGTDKDPVTFALRPSASGKIVRLMIIRRGMTFDPHHIKVTVSHAATPTKTTALAFGARDKKLEIFWINLEREALDGIGASEKLVVRGSGLNEEFALPQIGAVLTALQTCNDDLRKYWNADDDAGTSAIAAHARSVKPLAAYLDDKDYPTQALAEGASGKSRMTLLVDETGALKDCTVDETSGIASLDAMGCLVFMERAKFTPARDAAGKPVRSVVSTSITWKTSS
ncbi:MAG TPA: energy transducer TonB [Allosphingosinicella sp.]